ncbi:MAG: hypothetical protein D6741_03935 [Planctomycetota bacterium]|nr:MAG: hypothetical protein D6741_03935 [Planctomycetota bacterium]
MDISSARHKGNVTIRLSYPPVAMDDNGIRASHLSPFPLPNSQTERMEKPVREKPTARHRPHRLKSIRQTTSRQLFSPSA